jgi:hypothetical protein
MGGIIPPTPVLKKFYGGLHFLNLIYFINSRNQGKKPSVSEYEYSCQKCPKTYAHLRHKNNFPGLLPLDPERRERKGEEKGRGEEGWEGRGGEGEGRGGEGRGACKMFCAWGSQTG